MSRGALEASLALVRAAGLACGEQAEGPHGGILQRGFAADFSSFGTSEGFAWNASAIPLRGSMPVTEEVVEAALGGVDRCVTVVRGGVRGSLRSSDAAEALAAARRNLTASLPEGQAGDAAQEWLPPRSRGTFRALLSSARRALGGDGHALDVSDRLFAAIASDSGAVERPAAPLNVSLQITRSQWQLSLVASGALGAWEPQTDDAAEALRQGALRAPAVAIRGAGLPSRRALSGSAGAIRCDGTALASGSADSDGSLASVCEAVSASVIEAGGAVAHALGSDAAAAAWAGAATSTGAGGAEPLLEVDCMCEDGALVGLQMDRDGAALLVPAPSAAPSPAPGDGTDPEAGDDDQTPRGGSDGGSDGVGPGVIAGAAVGGLVAVGCVVAAIWYFRGAQTPPQAGSKHQQRIMKPEAVLQQGVTKGNAVAPMPAAKGAARPGFRGQKTPW